MQLPQPFWHAVACMLQWSTHAPLASGALDHARAVLRDCGNMSAATVLFVLERTLKANTHGRMLLSALGPGFTAGFLVLET